MLEGGSTVTALLHCTNEWLKALEDGKEVCAFFFVNSEKHLSPSLMHAPLMSKQVALGLDDHIPCWLNNYLAKRSQSVVVNGSISDPVRPSAVRSSPGIHIGPLTFP